MIIDTTNISTLGLRLLEVKNQLNLPKRKRILDQQEHTEANLIYEEFDVVVKLFGKYNSQALAAGAVQSLKALLWAKVVHDFTISTRGLGFKGIVKNGFEVTGYKKKIVILMNITVTECLTGNLTA